ncbi:hypothetical protein ATCC90586_000351 [Pythium insidiosum]|nr:hypothetical protein ATCC90586_000351 [Pythium insidiosum]
MTTAVLAPASSNPPTSLEPIVAMAKAGSPEEPAEATTPGETRAAEGVENDNLENESNNNASPAAPAVRFLTTRSPSKRLNKKRRRVAFEAAEIVEFEPTVYTTTVTSGGIPIGMSLEERSRSRRRLDSWELERKDERVGRQSYMEEGYLDPSERELILNNAGCAEQSMATVEAEVNQIIAHRRESNEMDFDFLYGLVNQIIAHRRESNEMDFDFLYGLVTIGEGNEEEEEEEGEEEEEEEEEEEDADEEGQGGVEEEEYEEYEEYVAVQDDEDEAERDSDEERGEDVEEVVLMSQPAAGEDNQADDERDEAMEPGRKSDADSEPER